MRRGGCRARPGRPGAGGGVVPLGQGEEAWQIRQPTVTTARICVKERRYSSRVAGWYRRPSSKMLAYLVFPAMIRHILYFAAVLVYDCPSTARREACHGITLDLSPVNRTPATARRASLDGHGHAGGGPAPVVSPDPDALVRVQPVVPHVRDYLPGVGRGRLPGPTAAGRVRPHPGPGAEPRATRSRGAGCPLPGDALAAQLRRQP